MAVSTTNAFDGPFTANGVTTAFPFTFTALADSDVAVQIDGVAVTSGFTVQRSSAGDGGGAVIFDTAPASGELYILLDPDFTQTTSFEDGSAWLASPVNRVNDRAALRDQSVKREVDRALRLPLGATVPDVADLSGANGQVLGIVDGVVQGVDNTVVAAADYAAQAENAQAAAEAAQTGAETASSTASDQATAASASAEAAATSEATASDKAASATVSEANSSLYSAAAQAAASGNFFSNTTEPLTNGVLALTMTANGSGGTAGTAFVGAFSGGGGSNAAFSFAVVGGAVVPGSVVITNKGTGYTSAPTPSFAASSGLTGAAATVTLGARTTAGDYLLVKGSAETYASLFRNVAGAITDQGLAIPSLAALSSAMVAPGEILDGYSTTILTGDGSMGVAAADGTSLQTGRLFTIGYTTYDTTFTSVTLYRRAAGATGLRLVALVQDDDGWWAYDADVSITDTASTVGERTISFSFASAGVRRICAYMDVGSAQRFAGAVVATEILDTTDPTTVSGASFTTVNQRPNILLTGIYSQVEDKGKPKKDIAALQTAVYGKPACDANGIYFGNKENLQRGQDALRALMAGEADCIDEEYGDSNTGGSHTGSNGTAATVGVVPANGTLGYTNARDYCDIAQFAALVSQPRPNGLALPVTYEAMKASNNVQGTYPLYNTRCLATGDLSVTGSAPTLTTSGGGVFLSASTGDNSSFVYQTKTAVRKFKVGFYKGTGYGTWQYDIDLSGSWTDVVATDTTPGYGEVEIDTGAAAIRTLRWRRKSGSADVVLAAIDAWNSDVPSLRLINAGFAGSTWLSWAQVVTYPWSPYNRVKNSAAHIKGIRLGTNDLDDGRDLDAVMADADSLIWAAMRQSCTIVWGVFPCYDDGSGRTIARQRQLRKRTREVALDNGAIYVDVYPWLGDYPVACASGLMDDQLHGNRAAAALMASVRLKTFASLL